MATSGMCLEVRSLCEVVWSSIFKKVTDCFLFLFVLAPMCGCVEKMPLVTQADCTEIEALEIWKLSKGYGDSSLRVSLDRAELSFNACDSKGNGQDNDLEDFYKRLKNEGRATEDDFDKLKQTLVRNVGCDQAVHDLF